MANKVNLALVGTALFIFIILTGCPGAGGDRLCDEGNVVVTVRDGLPCFSYPRNWEMSSKSYIFDGLAVSKEWPSHTIVWETQTKDRGKGLLEPNSPAVCIKYGGPHPGTENCHGRPADPFQIDTPYSVMLRVGLPPGYPGYESRTFCDGFCLTSDEKGNKVVVSTKYDSKTDKARCLKPGERPKRGFWEWLF